MSCATLRHDTRSRHAVDQLHGNKSNTIGFDLGSDDSSAMDADERGDLDRNFELKDLARRPNGSKHLRSTFGLELEDAHSDSDEEERSPRASVSTLQSFMLYTPDEETSVIRKFDCRLVLFVALLYMLSFLDRSSMFLYFFNHSLLTLVRHWKRKNCRVV